MDFMTLLAAIPGAGPLLPYLPVVIAVCAAVAATLPHPAAASTGAYPAIYAVVNFIALNIGKAKNAATPTSTDAQ
jgi:hypothetical protein